MAKKTVIKRLFKKLPQEKFDLATLEALRSDDNFTETRDDRVVDDCVIEEIRICKNKSSAIAAII
jgi:recombinational DNA repair protein RecT